MGWAGPVARLLRRACTAPGAPPRRPARTRPSSPCPMHCGTWSCGHMLQRPGARWPAQGDGFAPCAGHPPPCGARDAASARGRSRRGPCSGPPPGRSWRRPFCEITPAAPRLWLGRRWCTQWAAKKGGALPGAANRGLAARVRRSGAGLCDTRRRAPMFPASRDGAGSRVQHPIAWQWAVCFGEVRLCRGPGAGQRAHPVEVGWAVRSRGGCPALQGRSGREGGHDAALQSCCRRSGRLLGPAAGRQPGAHGGRAAQPRARRLAPLHRPWSRACGVLRSARTRSYMRARLRRYGRGALQWGHSCRKRASRWWGRACWLAPATARGRGGQARAPCRTAAGQLGAAAARLHINARRPHPPAPIEGLPGRPAGSVDATCDPARAPSCEHDRRSRSPPMGT